MAGTYLNFPFDEDVFLYNWRQLKDPTLTAFLDSGAMVEDSTIAGLIANGSDQYTVPLYGVLADTAPVNYTGATNITTEATAGASETGVVFGRAKGWEEKQFIRDRLGGKMYVIRSFWAGTSPQNNYTPSEPYSVTFFEDPYTYQNAGYAKLNVRSSGADSPRQITLRKKESTGQWFVWEIFFLSDIRIPVAMDEWA